MPIISRGPVLLALYSMGSIICRLFLEQTKRSFYTLECCLLAVLYCSIWLMLNCFFSLSSQKDIRCSTHSSAKGTPYRAQYSQFTIHSRQTQLSYTLCYSFPKFYILHSARVCFMWLFH
jgi:hypothetical protein